jgi:hypothetical protein
VGDGGQAAEDDQNPGGNGYVIVDLLGKSNLCAQREIPHVSLIL